MLLPTLSSCTYTHELWLSACFFTLQQLLLDLYGFEHGFLIYFDADGTTNFAHCYPSFAVSVGVLFRGKPAAATVVTDKSLKG